MIGPLKASTDFGAAHRKERAKMAVVTWITKDCSHGSPNRSDREPPDTLPPDYSMGRSGHPDIGHPLPLMEVLLECSSSYSSDQRTRK